MQCNFEEVEIQRINTEDTFYKITTCNEIDGISDSVRDIGIINPPVLVNEKDRFTIVSGFRRIKAAIKNGFLRIPVKTISSAKESIECAKIAISDNSFQRNLNQIEQARAIHLLTCFYRSPEEISDIAAGLGLPANPSIIQKLITISRTDKHIQDYILSETLSMTTALLIDKLHEKHKLPMARFIHSLNVGLNNQREVLILLTEISKRENKDLLELLAEKSIADIINEPNREVRQKAAQIRKLLRKRRFPELTKAEDTFSDCVKKLKLDQSLKLLPPKDFEGTTYLFQISFNSYEDLLRQQIQLEEVIGNPILKQILK
ncbi:MAG: hypothetical protein C4522_14230 [Desulfobacteraceae bacterium]|nr:MAG: hypothetical protein C4522_14230 [Desulfobacteraceae bacterium]